MLFVEILFWVCVAGVAYAYFGYPLLLAMLSRSRTRREILSAGAADDWPSLTVLIAARNESARIEAKLDDVVAQDYPSDKLEVIVVSDGSTDTTPQLVRAYGSTEVQCIELEANVGKESAQARGIAAARGDIIVFTDVATRIGGQGLKGMAQALSAPDIGAVSSEDRFVSAEGKPVGEGLYVRYEMWLRKLESRVSGLVGLSGSLFGVRRELCDEWPVDVPSDFVVALRCARRGQRAVSLPEVYGIYSDLKKDSAEFARKRRTAIRGMAGLASATEVLNPRRYGLFALQAWSHKIIRWAVPWFMLGALGCNFLLLAESGLYQVLLGLQLLAYGITLAAAMLPVLRRVAPARILYFFVISNLALAFALVEFLRGRRVVRWEPSVR